MKTCLFARTIGGLTGMLSREPYCRYFDTSFEWGLSVPDPSTDVTEK